MTLSLDLTDPQRLELFPLLFAFNYVGTEVARALRVGDMANVVSLQTPLNELRGEQERRDAASWVTSSGSRGSKPKSCSSRPSRRRETRISTSLTELARKWDVVSQHLRQLLRLLAISGSVALALSAFYVALGLTTLLLHAARFSVLAGSTLR